MRGWFWRTLATRSWARYFAFALASAIYVVGVPSVSAQTAEEPAGLVFLESGISSVEDGPFVPDSYTFLPGDYVHFVFEVSGVKLRGDENSKNREISLTY